MQIDGPCYSQHECHHERLISTARFSLSAGTLGALCVLPGCTYVQLFVLVQQEHVIPHLCCNLDLIFLIKSLWPTKGKSHYRKQNPSNCLRPEDHPSDIVSAPCVMNLTADLCHSFAFHWHNLNHLDLLYCKMNTPNTVI